MNLKRQNLSVYFVLLSIFAASCNPVQAPNTTASAITTTPVALSTTTFTPVPTLKPISTLPPTPSLTDVGLNWKECLVTKGSPKEGFNWAEVETCFGHFMPLWSDEENANFGAQVNMENFRITIGNDVYETRLTDNSFPSQKYMLYKNDDIIQSLSGEFTSISPNISLQNVGGKVAWEFLDKNGATIIYDGIDVRSLYGIDKAYRPYGINGKLIFVGKKGSLYYIVYNGQKVGTTFDKIFIAYCCEPAAWSVQYGKGTYLFWGSRNEQWYMVEITSALK